MASSIQTLAEKAQTTFTKSRSDESFSTSLTEFIQSFSNIQASDINFNPNEIWDNSDEKHTMPMLGIRIFENTNFIINAFVLQDGAHIPLHDHPGMYGFIKVIHGTVRISSYSKLSNASDDIVTKLNKLKLQTDSLIPVRLHMCKDFTCKDEPSVLTPEEGNYHGMCAMNGTAAMIDILSPPYNYENLDYHVYSLLETKGADSQGKMWLNEVPYETNYWIRTIEYTGPKVSL